MAVRGTTVYDALSCQALYVGTVTGSYITGTPSNDTVPFSALIGTSIYALVGTIVGSQAHGLGAVPTSVQVTSMMNYGTFAYPYERAAADATNCFVSAGTTGTVQITVIA